MNVKRNVSPSEDEDDRRAFLGRCGRFGALTSPEVVMLLSTSLTSDAVVVSSASGPEVASMVVGRSTRIPAATQASAIVRKR